MRRGRLPSGGPAEGETIWSETRRGIAAGTAADGKAKLDMAARRKSGRQGSAANPCLVRPVSVS